MCLYKDEGATEKFLKKYEGKDEVVVWKLYRVYDGDVSGLYHRVFGISSGVILSDRRCKFYDDYDKDLGSFVHRGIHVYTTRRKARREGWGDTRVFKCTAKIKDLVGVDECQEEAVFMKINITPEEFEKGKKGRN